MTKTCRYLEWHPHRTTGENVREFKTIENPIKILICQLRMKLLLEDAAMRELPKRRNCKISWIFFVYSSKSPLWIVVFCTHPAIVANGCFRSDVFRLGNNRFQTCSRSLFQHLMESHRHNSTPLTTTTSSQCRMMSDYGITLFFVHFINCSIDRYVSSVEQMIFSIAKITFTVRFSLELRSQ